METTAHAKTFSPSGQTEKKGWLCLDAKAVVCCSTCGQKMLIPTNIIIHARTVQRGTILCDQNHVLSLKDFIRAGGILKNGRDAVQSLN